MSQPPIIQISNIEFQYEDEEALALKGVSLDIYPGEMLAIIGHNGSGKSTLAKMLNGLLRPTSGSVLVDSMDTQDENAIWEIRQTVGFVFQNPDNQIVATIVEEDVAFGLENIGVPPPKIRERVDDALRSVRMTEFAQAAPHMLSGGQKQRIAIAGVVAMRPRVIVLDESTAMLDPLGRAEVLETIRRLNAEHGITVVWITHFMEEAVTFDRVAVFDEGAILQVGTPREIFTQVEALQKVGLDVPPMATLALALRNAGIDIPADTMTVEEMERVLCQLR